LGRGGTSCASETVTDFIELAALLAASLATAQRMADEFYETN
jgi:hypothetical protein